MDASIDVGHVGALCDQQRPSVDAGVSDAARGDRFRERQPPDQPPRCGRSKSRRIGGRFYQAAALRLTARRAPTVATVAAGRNFGAYAKGRV
jgi:hypothetical protein